MTRKWILTLAALAWVLAACGGTDGQAPDGLVVKAKEFAYVPGDVEVAAGESVTLVLQNTGSLQHDLAIEFIATAEQARAAGPARPIEPGGERPPQLRVAAAAGQSASITFTPTEPGRYEFFCTVPGHRQSGMTGTLVVDEAAD
jgi:uncharacterized cupredoxin-like copper-binding protein